MPSTKKFDVVAKVGEYEGKDGQKKAKWMNCGAIFENENGKLSLKMEANPVGGNGWFALFSPKTNDSASRSAVENKEKESEKEAEKVSEPVHEPAAESNALAKDSDDVPF